MRPLNPALEKMQKSFSKIRPSTEDQSRVREEVFIANRTSLYLFTSIAAILWFVCLIAPIFVLEFRTGIELTLGNLAFSLILLVCTKYLLDKQPRTIGVLTALFDISLLAAGLIVSFIYMRDYLSITYIGFLMGVPLLFIDKPSKSIALYILMDAIYFVVAPSIKPSDLLPYDMFAIVMFSIIGICIGGIINRERLERYIYSASVQKLAEEQAYLANHDQLTRLKNRLAYVEEEARLAENVEENTCLIMADINGLKSTNDTLGHDAGDEIIIAAASCIMQAFEGEDRIYRIGGDEFCILLCGNADEAPAKLVALKRALDAWKGELAPNVTMSYGASYVGPSNELTAMSRDADQKMYEQKRAFYQSKGTDRRSTAC